MYPTALHQATEAQSIKCAADLIAGSLSVSEQKRKMGMLLECVLIEKGDNDTRRSSRERKVSKVEQVLEAPAKHETQALSGNGLR